MSSLSLKNITSIVFLAILLPACDQQDGSQSIVENASAPDQPLVWVPGWQNGPLMHTPRSGAASVKISGVIHVIGGVDGKDFQRSSEYIRIADDGSLSAWRLGPELNTERGFFAAVRSDKYLYVVGGGQGAYGKDLLNSVERAAILPDGTIDNWTVEKYTLNTKRRCAKLAILGKHIYAFGGFSGILLDTVERAEILPDGSLGEWEVMMDNMNLARYIHGVKKVANRVYMVGGHDKEKGAGITAVEWSREDSEGWLEPWQISKPLQTGRYGLATVQHGDFLYALGGLGGAAYLESVEKARINSDGSLSGWTFTTPLPSRREGANALVVKNNIYFIGGTNLTGYKSSIEYGSFNEDGDIGYWAKPAEAKEQKARLALQQAKNRVLPNEAVIVSHEQTEHYSYLMVKRDDGLFAWLAAPVSDVSADARIRFPNGVVMRGFYSKELKREFPAIMFVGEVQKVRALQVVN
ncbi:hypothetical protein MNBD_GAMMA26-67 [hydrothermal vent metagenome]|uniref:Uncharacterized protein n=1 Tax=hydrothermal vent metagenome TaxID=652676 RepID=A0A3B1B061_9ZZZZ